MRTIRPLFTTLVLICIATGSFAQSIARQSINSFGTSNVSGGISISETVGQAYTTQAGRSGSLIFHPGFQQHMIAGEKKLVIDEENFHVEIYPNPASTELWIMPSRVIDEAVITILDMNGKVIQETSQKQLHQKVLDVSDFPAGLYAIKIFRPGSHESTSARILIIK